VVPTIPHAIMKVLKNVCGLPALSQRSCRKSSWIVANENHKLLILVARSVDCLQGLVWSWCRHFGHVSVMSIWVSVIGYTIYGNTFGFWIMATRSTHPFSYSYLIQLLMWPTLKVLKCVNRQLCSSQKFTNETGKSLRDGFWCGICKFDTLFSIIYSWLNYMHRDVLIYWFKLESVVNSLI